MWPGGEPMLTVCWTTSRLTNTPACNLCSWSVPPARSASALPPSPTPSHSQSPPPPPRFFPSFVHRALHQRDRTSIFFVIYYDFVCANFSTFSNLYVPNLFVSFCQADAFDWYLCVCWGSFGKICCFWVVVFFFSLSYDCRGNLVLCVCTVWCVCMNMCPLWRLLYRVF